MDVTIQFLREYWRVLAIGIGLVVAITLIALLHRRTRLRSRTESVNSDHVICIGSDRVMGMDSSILHERSRSESHSPLFGLFKNARKEGFNAAAEAQILVKGLPSGMVAFNPPKNMMVSVAEDIEARVTASYETEGWLKNMAGKGTAEIEKIDHVSAYMAAALIAPDFQIVDINSEEQMLPMDGYTSWRWQITPKSQGMKMLFLRISCRIPRDGRDEKIDLPVFEREIAVSVDRGTLIKDHFKKNWMWWVATPLGIPAFVAAIIQIYVHLTDNGNDAKAPPPPSASAAPAPKTALETKMEPEPGSPPADETDSK